MRALVTGGGGFIGGAIIRALLARGDEVVSLSRGSYPALEALGVDCQRGDIADNKPVMKAAAGCDVVFHVAAKAGVWGSYNQYYRANVQGTRNVLAACRRHEIKRLVFTSSPSVVFDGKAAEGIDETTPYPDDFDSHYTRTKALSEEMVLTANDDKLKTVALRPRLVWGPGDNHIAPRLLAKAKAGKLRRIGNQIHKVDTTYIDNAVDAHLLAEENLRNGSSAAGKAYFISQGDPRPLWDIINGILVSAGVPPADKSIPRPVAMALAGVAELAYKVLRIDREPPLTRFMVRQMSTTAWYDISAAKRDLGYEPKVSIEQGMEKLKKWFGDGSPQV